jgi:hypothetical protein
MTVFAKYKFKNKIMYLRNDLFFVIVIVSQSDSCHMDTSRL